VTSCEDLLCIDDPVSGGFYRWKKACSHFAREMVSACSIALDLFTAHNRHSGTLLIYRLYTTRELQLDVNLLTSVFPIALAEALDRCRLSEPEMISPRAQTALAARAG